MAGEYTFLPNLQTAVAGRATAPQNGTRREVRIGVQVLANGAAQGAPHDVGAELLGAGDIVSLDSSMVTRVEPSSTSRAVEPNYFPSVELRDADFPWRYSLDAGNPRRMRPWLLLIALEAAEFRYLGGGSVLPRIEVFDSASSLPDAGQSWAFAHVQVSGAHRLGGLDRALTASAEASHSRLLCPRRLKDNTPYTLFLVPTYEAGRRAGIGIGGPAAPWNSFAWDVARSDPVELPFYAQWTFRTSTLEDFESLVRRLQPLSGDEESPLGGTRTVFSGRPGYYDDFDDPGLTFEAEGALQRVGFERAQPLIEETALTPRLETTLTEVIESDLDEGIVDGPEQEDPLVALPVYGRHFARPEAIAVEGTSTPWVHEVNLDPRLRLAAGVGARIVKRHQEPFMEKCWRQAGEIQRANRLRVRLQLLTRINGVLEEKHLAPLAPSVAWQIAAPLLHTVKTPFSGNRTMQADLRFRGVPDGEASPLVRRLVAKRPDVDTARRASVTGGAERTPPPSGLARALTRLPRPSATVIERATKRVEARRAAVADASDLAQLIPVELAATQAISFDRPSFEVGSIDSVQVVNTVMDRIRELPGRKAIDLIAGTAPAEGVTLEPIMRSPRLPIPVSTHVEEEDANHLLPNVGELPENSVTIVEENRAFIESVMAGANHEMNRELRWREFPTDMSASVFTRFWGSGHAPDDITGDDLHPLHEWDGHAGEHFRRDKPSLTLVIHGDLVRRYPDLLVAANRQVIPQGGKWDASRGTTTYPVFTGVIGDATGFYGFDLTVDEVRAGLDDFYFVLYEPANRFRFGLDIATYGARTSRRRLGRAPMEFPLATMPSTKRAVLIRSVQGFWNVTPQPVGPVPADLNDLSWEHVTLDAAGYVDFDRQVSFADGSDLLGPVRTSASIARATLQRPISAVVPAKRMLSDA